MSIVIQAASETEGATSSSRISTPNLSWMALSREAWCTATTLWGDGLTSRHL